MNFIERLNKIIDYYKLKPSEFAEEIKVPRSSVSHILSMRNNPSLDFIMNIKHRFPDLEWSWLIEGKGNMLLPSSTFHNKFIDNSATNLSTIELTGNISDNPILRENEIKEYTPEENILSDSQQLEFENNISLSTNNEENKIKRIIIFYENGKFESFEP